MHDIVRSLCFSCYTFWYDARSFHVLIYTYSRVTAVFLSCFFRMFRRILKLPFNGEQRLFNITFAWATYCGSAIATTIGSNWLLVSQTNWRNGCYLIRRNGASLYPKNAAQYSSLCLKTQSDKRIPTFIVDVHHKTLQQTNSYISYIIVRV